MLKPYTKTFIAQVIEKCKN